MEFFSKGDTKIGVYGRVTAKMDGEGAVRIGFRSQVIERMGVKIAPADGSADEVEHGIHNSLSIVVAFPNLLSSFLPPGCL